jgi:hypothetical protein
LNKEKRRGRNKKNRIERRKDEEGERRVLGKISETGREGG